MQLKLLKHCASDVDVVNAARVSLDNQELSKTDLHEKDVGLIGFLMRKRHGTPFEHGYFQFYVEAPIFVFREWHRHRVGHSYNEMSGRYTELPTEVYDPEELRVQKGKPGNYTFEPISEKGIRGLAWRFRRWRLYRKQKAAFRTYNRLLKKGVAKEQARAVLPVGTYTKMYWSCNPRSLMHFLGLRHKPDAQKEIRELAELAAQEFQKVMPVTYQAFVDNGERSP